MEFVGLMMGISIVIILMAIYDANRDGDIKAIKQQLQDIKELLNKEIE